MNFTPVEPAVPRLMRVVLALQPGWTEEHARKRIVLDLKAMRHARIHANLPVEAFAKAYAKSYARIMPGAVPDTERRKLELEARALLLGEVS